MLTGVLFVSIAVTSDDSGARFALASAGFVALAPVVGALLARGHLSELSRVSEAFLWTVALASLRVLIGRPSLGLTVIASVWATGFGFCAAVLRHMAGERRTARVLGTAALLAAFGVSMFLLVLHTTTDPVLTADSMSALEPVHVHRGDPYVHRDEPCPNTWRAGSVNSCGFALDDGNCIRVNADCVSKASFDHAMCTCETVQLDVRRTPDGQLVAKRTAPDCLFVGLCETVDLVTGDHLAPGPVVLHRPPLIVRAPPSWLWLAAVGLPLAGALAARLLYLSRRRRLGEAARELGPYRGPATETNDATPPAAPAWAPDWLYVRLLVAVTTLPSILAVIARAAMPLVQP